MRYRTALVCGIGLCIGSFLYVFVAKGMMEQIEHFPIPLDPIIGHPGILNFTGFIRGCTGKTPISPLHQIMWRDYGRASYKYTSRAASQRIEIISRTHCHLSLRVTETRDKHDTDHFAEHQKRNSVRLWRCITVQLRRQAIALRQQNPVRRITVRGGLAASARTGRQKKKQSRGHRQSEHW